MTLLAEQMAERRDRILEAARALIAARGFDGLTMRELAQEAGVTVPTIYNLVGNKDEVLFSTVREQTDRWLQGIDPAAGDVLAVVDANVRELLSNPPYYRSLIKLLMTSDAAGTSRENVGRTLDALIRRALGELAEAGELEPWIDLRALQRQIQTRLWITSIGWADGEITDDQLGPQSRYGTAMLLLAASRESGRDEYARVVRETQAPRSRDREGNSNVTSLESRT